MKPGDLVHYFTNAPKRVTDCGVFHKRFGLVLEVHEDSNEVTVMSDGNFSIVDIRTVELAFADSWFSKSGR